MADSAEPPRSVEEVKAMLETTEKGGFRNSMSNCLTVFQCDPLLSGAVAYNLLTDRTDILKPIGYKRTAGSPMTDTDMKYNPAVSGKDLWPDKREKDTGRRRPCRR